MKLNEKKLVASAATWLLRQFPESSILDHAPVTDEPRSVFIHLRPGGASCPWDDWGIVGTSRPRDDVSRSVEVFWVVCKDGTVRKHHQAKYSRRSHQTSSAVTRDNWPMVSGVWLSFLGWSSSRPCWSVSTCSCLRHDRQVDAHRSATEIFRRRGAGTWLDQQLPGRPVTTRQSRLVEVTAIRLRTRSPTKFRPRADPVLPLRRPSY